MKRFLFSLTILVFLTVKSSAQYNAFNDTALLKTLYQSEIQKQIDAGNLILYTDISINPKSIFEEYSKQTILGEGKDTIVLSQNDREKFLNQLNQNPNSLWPDGLFPNSRKASIDSIFDMFPILYAANDPQHVKGHEYFYSFSRPFYIRNNNVALIGFARVCGDQCVDMQTAFYQMKNGRWQLKAILYQGHM